MLKSERGSGVPDFSSPTYRFEQEQFIARPLSEVFIFFSNAFNLFAEVDGGTVVGDAVDAAFQTP
jgi:hypothetical protein